MSRPVVLLVDDEPALRRLYTRMLSRICDTVEAADAKQALALKGRVDLALVDVSLPGMDGVELGHLLQGQVGGPQCLFVSGHCRSDVAARYGLQPHDAFLAKPFNRQDLLQAVQDLLEDPAVWQQASNG